MHHSQKILSDASFAVHIIVTGAVGHKGKGGKYRRGRRQEMRYEIRDSTSEAAKHSTQWGILNIFSTRLR